jgi:hypothetical protein
VFSRQAKREFADPQHPCAGPSMSFRQKKNPAEAGSCVSGILPSSDRFLVRTRKSQFADVDTEVDALSVACQG